MSNPVSVKFEGGKKLERAMRRLPIALEKKVARQGLRAGAKIWQRALKRDLPRSGEPDGVVLADSIALARPRARRRDAYIEVGVKGLARLYAHIVEFGNSTQPANPVWRRVFKREGGQVITTVAEKIGDGIIKEVRRGN